MPVRMESIMSNSPGLQLYQPSGKLGSSPLLLVLLGLPLCLLWSVAYAYADVYIPIGGVFTVVLVGGFTFLLGLTIAQVGKLAKCRNATVLRLMGMGIGTLSLYAAWASFLHALFAQQAGDTPSIVEFALNPRLMWEAICAVNETGWYSIKSTTPSGIVLWLFWGVEIVVVIGGSWLFAELAISNELFCETCNRWCPAGDMTYHEPTAELMSAATDSISPVALLALPPLPAKTIPAIRAELLQCPGCKRAGVRFSRLRHERSDKGELVEKTDAIPGILLPPGQPAG